MKRLVAALVLLVTMLALVLAYGVERQSADETKGTGSSQETQPMVATTPSPAVGLQEQLDELVLGEGDVPAGFHTLLTDMVSTRSLAVPHGNDSPREHAPCPKQPEDDYVDSRLLPGRHCYGEGLLG
jgi:hypothetical protein